MFWASWSNQAAPEPTISQHDLRYSRICCQRALQPLYSKLQEGCLAALFDSAGWEWNLPGNKKHVKIEHTKTKNRIQIWSDMAKYYSPKIPCAISVYIGSPGASAVPSTSHRSACALSKWKWTAKQTSHTSVAGRPSDGPLHHASPKSTGLGLENVKNRWE